MKSRITSTNPPGSEEQHSKLRRQKTFTQIDLVKDARADRPLNIGAIAKRAKVSIATVSRAINHASSVNPQLAERIHKIIEAQGYCPSVHARALVSGHSRIFGLIIPEITNPFFPQVVSSFEEIAVEHGYELLLMCIENNPRLIQTSLRRMIGRRVEGIAILTFGVEQDLLKNFQSQNVPLVLIDADPTHAGISNIKIDYRHGIRQAVQHLAALGHEQIAFVSGPLQLRSAEARKDAFLQSLEEINIKVSEHLVVEGNHTIEAGMLALTQLLKKRPRPTAIVCSNDMTALGVMRRAYELGIKVPQHLSIVGFDDIHLAKFVLPALTTVQLSQTELARLAFGGLWNNIQYHQAYGHGKASTLVTQLVLRESTYLAPDK